MGSNLLIRAYNVGCGDCIYVRIPDKKDAFHILIDCGKKGDTASSSRPSSTWRKTSFRPAARKAANASTSLSPPTGMKITSRASIRLRLRISRSATSGSASPWIRITNRPKERRVCTPSPPSKCAASCNAHALSPQVEALAAMYGVSNDQADDFLLEALPKAKAKRHFVHAGMTSKDLGLKLPPIR